MQDRNSNRRGGGRSRTSDDERQPLTNESALGRPGRGPRSQSERGPVQGRPQFDDGRQPLTSENPYTTARGDRRDRPRDDRRGGPRDDRPRDNNRGGPRDDRRGGPRDDRPRDNNRGGPRDDSRRGGPRDDRRGGPRDDRPRDNNRGGPRDDSRRGGPRDDPRGGRPRQGGGEVGFSRPFPGDERQPVSNESPALRGREGGGGRGRGGSAPRGRGGQGQGKGRAQGGRGRTGSSGFGTPASRRKDSDDRRSKAYVSDAFIYRENLDEAKPTERKMRSRRNKPSGGEVQGE